MQKNIMKPIRIGIVGAGISGLTMAYNLNKIYKKNNIPYYICIFQARNRPGGRIKTHTISQLGCKYNENINSNKKQMENSTNQQIELDLGANLIDFQTQQSQKIWNQLLPEAVTSVHNNRLKLFKFPFLIYNNQTQQLRKGDYQKNRYYYQGGFKQLINDILAQLQPQTNNIEIKQSTQLQCLKKTYLLQNSEVVSITVNKQVNLQYINKNQANTRYSRSFDKLYISCPAPQALNILTNPNSSDNSKNKEIKNIMQYYTNNKIEYTKQLSIAYKTHDKITSFSCILFQKHPIITFICSHQQKYNQQTIVVQLTEQYSSKNYDASVQQIERQVYQSLPMQLKQMIQSGCGIINRWSVSLVKARGKTQKNSNMQANQTVNIIGDSLMMKSRVSGAVESVKYLLAKL